MPSPLTDDVPSELPRVGRYELLLELQDEAFVSVMAARVRGPNTGSSIVELTKVEHTLARQAEVRAAFLAEARAAGRVRHANFVHPTDTLVHEGDLYVATEFSLGVRLDELWRAASAARVEIPLPVMLRILLDVVAGLSALHARHPRGPNVGGTRSIVHGDIAPTNILVSYRGDAKLVHSGLSCVTSLPGATGQRNRRLAYKAPEQLRIGVNAVPISPAADVFALGALLWEVLQGRRLFDAATDVEVVERILQGPLSSPGIGAFPSRCCRSWKWRSSEPRIGAFPTLLNSGMPSSTRRACASQPTTKYRSASISWWGRSSSDVVKA
jgi:eukaryotic-like serine/threonine-protein kinase